MAAPNMNGRLHSTDFHQNSPASFNNLKSTQIFQSLSYKGGIEGINHVINASEGSWTKWTKLTLN